MLTEWADTWMGLLSAPEIHLSSCSDVQTQFTDSVSSVFHGQKHSCFQSIESALVLWQVVSEQALDNVLFDGVQWLTRPHLSPRPLLLSSPHTLPCKNQNAHRHPPTDSFVCAHTQSHTQTLCILSLEDSGSCLCYWTGYHITAGTASCLERKSPAFFKKGSKRKKAEQRKWEQADAREQAELCLHRIDQNHYTSLLIYFTLHLEQVLLTLVRFCALSKNSHRSVMQFWCSKFSKIWIILKAIF